MAQRDLGRPPLREIRDSWRWDDWNARLYDRVNSPEQIDGNQVVKETVQTDRVVIKDIDQPSAETLGNLISESGSEGLNLTFGHMGYNDGNQWRNYFDSDGNALIGDKSNGEYLEWDESSGTLIVRGDILVPWDGGVDDRPERLLDTVQSGYTGLKITDSYLGYFDDGTPVNYFDSDGNAIIGDSSSDNYVEWDQSEGTLTVNGTVKIKGGDGALNLDDGPEQSGAVRDWSRLNDDGGKPEDNADVTGNNTAKDIVNLPDTPSGSAGLFADSDYLGYHNGDDWQVYIGANGDFFFEGDNGNYISWEGSQLIVEGKLQSSIIESSTIFTDSSGQRIEITSPEDTGDFGEPDKIIFYNDDGDPFIRLGGIDGVEGELTNFVIEESSRRNAEFNNSAGYRNLTLRTEGGSTGGTPQLYLDLDVDEDPNDEVWIGLASPGIDNGYAGISPSPDGFSLSIGDTGTKRTLQHFFHTGLAAGSHGAIVFAKYTGDESINFGDGVSGSDLETSDASGNTKTTLSGGTTYKCLGAAENGSVTLWCRET